MKALSNTLLTLRPSKPNRRGRYTKTRGVSSREFHKNPLKNLNL